MADSPRRALLARQKKQARETMREHARNRRVVRVLVMFVVVVLAFTAGFLVRGQSAWMLSLGFPVQDEVALQNTATSVKSTYDSVSARISEVEDLLASSSLEDYELQDATDAMVDALLKATNDPYATYYNPDRYVSYVQESADRSYAGIGVLLADYDGRAYVVDVFEGSQAEARGVRRGDFVLAIDGDASRTWSVTEAVNALARDDGESATVTWMRPISLDAETGEEYTTTLTCRMYEAANVETELVDGVGYIRLRQITQSAGDLVKSAVSELKSQGALAFVLDIRDNPGGYLTQAVDIASLFVQSGVVVEIETVDGTTTKTASGVTITDAPVAVLVNEYTSAAAEVLASALQGNRRAEVVGSTTMGKGSVQVMRELSFGGAVRYTAAYYRSPLGHDIDGVGVVPDVAVGSSSDAQSDTQLMVALELARSLARS